MEKISVVDYIGYCDEKGDAIGHSLKTLKEAIKILKNKFNIKLILTEDYIKYFEEIEITYSLKLTSKINYKKGIIFKIYFIVQKMYYLKYILKSETNIWFINTDFWLFLSLALTKKYNNQKIYVTNYVDYYSDNNFKSKIKKSIFNKALKKIDYIFTTNSNIKLDKHIFIPDYIYDSIKYKPYLVEKKEKLVYMCGTMNDAKDIDGLIKAFNINKEKLIIRGYFSDEKEYDRLQNKQSLNIKIINERVDDNEYYRGIARSMFLVLPYKREHYNNRSSGVILEAIFLGTIVIAPNFLLNQLNISGIGYDDIKELENFNIENISEEVINNIKSNNQVIMKRYDYNFIKRKYIEILNGCKV